MIHQLKIQKQWFEEQISGIKSYEIRKNDRNFCVGDFLALNEVVAAGVDRTINETGRCCLVEIVHILENTTFLQNGFVVLSTRPCCIARHERIGALRNNRSLWNVDCYGERTETPPSGKDSDK